MLELWPDEGPIVVRSQGLILREWHPNDIPLLKALYDTGEMDRWTPVASPFDLEAAHDYLDRAWCARENSGAVQLAITEDGSAVLGEIIAFPADSPEMIELAYAVAAEHQGRGVATRAVTAMLTLAAAAGLARVRLLIARDNLASQRIAEHTGFATTPQPFVERRRKGYVLQLETWELWLTGHGQPSSAD